MSDYTVHRCRLFNYLPSAIQCMAYNKESKELAVSRSTGSIEIWETKNIWFQKIVIPGSEESNVQTLIWVGMNLFSGGLHGNILQYDLTKASVKTSTDSCGGAVWSLASSPKQDKLVAGCEDGSLKLFELKNKKVVFKKAFSKQEGRILCVAWHQDDDIIVSGSCDLIRIWSVKTGHAVQRITLERLCKKIETIVWSVTILADYTVVSGDSSGRIQFFNGKNATLNQSFQVHRADVLCIKSSEDEKSIYAAGVDPQVIEFKLLSNPNNEDLPRNWVKGRMLQKHTHDVRSISIVENSVVSGGVDTNILLRSMGVKKSNFKRIHSFSMTPLVSCTKDLNFFVFQYSNYLDIWSLSNLSQLTENVDYIEEKPVKLLQIKAPQNNSQIVCSNISNCGNWIVYSTMTSSRLYKLNHNNLECSVERVNCVGLLSAHKIVFSPDSKLLIASLRNHKIIVVQLNPTSNEATLMHLVPVTSADCITHLLSVSTDSRFIATGNINGKIQVYDLPTMTHYHTLPLYPQTPTSLAFNPPTNDLVIVYGDLQVFEFSLLHKQYTDWTKNIHTSNTSLLALNKAAPSKNRCNIAAVTDILFNVKDNLMLLVSREGIYTFPKDNKWTGQNNVPRFFRKFEPLLYCKLVQENSLFVVERPLQDIWSTFPPTLYQKKFGT